jgi:hypothetical protein
VRVYGETKTERSRRTFGLPAAAELRPVITTGAEIMDELFTGI